MNNLRMDWAPETRALDAWSCAVCGAHHAAFTTGQALVQGTVAQYTFISPNVCNDWHDCPIATGDTWLRTHMDGYAQWARTHDSVLFVTTDENNGSGLAEPVMTIAVGQGIAHSRQSAHVTHDSLLRTVEDWFHLAHLNDTAAASPLPGLPRF